jgi:hypothetical protein
MQLRLPLAKFTHTQSYSIALQKCQLTILWLIHCPARPARLFGAPAVAG